LAARPLDYGFILPLNQDEKNVRKDRSYGNSKKTLEIELRNALKEVELLRNKGLMYEEL